MQHQQQGVILRAESYQQDPDGRLGFQVHRLTDRGLDQRPGHRGTILWCAALRDCRLEEHRGILRDALNDARVLQPERGPEGVVTPDDCGQGRLQPADVQGSPQAERRGHEINRGLRSELMNEPHPLLAAGGGIHTERRIVFDPERMGAGNGAEGRLWSVIGA